jgi:putative hemolysin
LERERGKIFKLPLPASRALPKRLSAAVAGAVENVLSLGRLDSVYRDIGAKDETKGFIDESLQKLKIHYDVSENDLAAVPATGPLVVVANHPFGGMEGLILGALLLRVRPDVKIMANYLLGRIPELRDLLLCVDPFGTRAATMRNARPLKEALKWLQGGHALAVFPAGSVSHLHVRERKVIDPEWNTTIARLVHKAQAYALPVFFDGANSLFFQLAGMIHPKLRTALLPHELLNKGKKSIRIRIGSVIPFRKMETLDDEKLTGYLRMRTYALKHRCLEAARGTAMNADRLSVLRPVVSGAAEPAMICREVDSLPSRQLLLESEGFAVFYAKAHQIPNLLFEIGRLREVTFRKVGEGTGRPVDLGRFDLYYTHLFVWSTKTREIVGAYRLGQVDLILGRFGKRGLYTHTLFDFNQGFLQHVYRGIELGRSFVREEYQRLYSPLLLLWKGIARFVALNPRYTILFGPVTISDAYSDLSRQLIVSYMTVNHYAPDLARFIRPRKPPKNRSLKRLGLEDYSRMPTDIDDLSALVADIEADRKGVPVLLKQYVKLGGRLMGFNIDSSFGNGLDGLIMVDLLKCDRKLLDRYMGKQGAADFFGYHDETPQRDLAS